LSLKVGDKAVYAPHGIGEVTGIERREVSGRRQRFYILRLLESGSTLMVPTERAPGRGLRTVIPESEVRAVLAVLRERQKAPPSRQAWSRRHRAYMDKLNTGSVYDAAEVVRELSLLRRRKELSFSERRVLETARSMLVTELAIARQEPSDRIAQELEDIFEHRC